MFLILGVIVTKPALAAGYTVTVTEDSPDAAPGDGVCESVVGGCTLRAAVMEANATPGGDRVTVAPGTYNLTLAGEDDTAALGDLDVTRDLIIAGSGASTTVIDAATLEDRHFSLLGPRTLKISGVTLQNGRSEGGDGGGVVFMPDDEQTLELTDVAVLGNSAGASEEECTPYGDGTRCQSEGGSGGVIRSLGTLSTLILDNVRAEGNSAEGGRICWQTSSQHWCDVFGADASAIEVEGDSSTLEVTGSSFTDNEILVQECRQGAQCYNYASSNSSTIRGDADSLTVSVATTEVRLNEGRGLYVDSEEGSLNVAGSTIKEHTGVDYGGGIYYYSEAGEFTLSNSEVTDNVARRDGGGIYVYNEGGITTVAGSTVSDNVAQDGSGGGMFQGCCGAFTVTDSHFDRNDADQEGGGIYYDCCGGMTLTGSTVDDNTTRRGNGAGIHHDCCGSLTIVDSSVSGNEITEMDSYCYWFGCYHYGRYGAGVYYGCCGGITIRGSQIDDNGGPGAFYGGGLYTDCCQTLEIADSSFEGNEAMRDGGGLYVNCCGETTITNTMVNDNIAWDGGGGGFYNGGCCTQTDISDSHFNRNFAEYGGGVYNYDGSLTLTRSTVNGNGFLDEADEPADGETPAVINDPVYAELGGGIYNEYAKVKLIESSVDNNFADDGAGIYNYDGSLNTSLTSVNNNGRRTDELGNAYRTQFGGGIYTEYGETNLADSQVHANFAEEEGGGIFVYWDSLKLQGTTVRRNGFADLSTVGAGHTKHGAGIYSYNSEVAMTDSTVDQNVAQLAGGGLYHGYGQSAEVPVGSIRRSTFSNNFVLGDEESAGQGGAVYNEGALSAVNSTVAENRAEDDGAGFYNDRQLRLQNNTIARNTARAGSGGGLHNEGTAEVEDTILAENFANGENSNCSGNTPSSEGHNLTDDRTCAFGARGDRNDVTDIGLGALRWNGGRTQTIALQEGSAALDSGECPMPETDQRGVTRGLDGDGDGTAACDIGAFEASALVIEPPPPPPAATLDVSPETAVNQLPEEGTHTLTVSVANAAEGTEVDFKILSGPNATEDLASSDFSCTTNATGACEVSYESNGEAGADEICAWIDADGDAVFDLSGDSSDGADCNGEASDEEEGLDDTDLVQSAWTEAPAPTEVSSLITIKYRDDRDLFKGRVSSERDECVAGRRVLVKKEVEGRDLVKGRVFTDEDGRWRFKRTDAKGSFYAVAKRVQVMSGEETLDCLKARSETIEV